MKNVCQKSPITSSLVALVACPTTQPQPVTPKPPFVSAVGTTTGNKVTKIIDSTGGTISITDGSITLEISAGTFSSTNEISVQPVSNKVAPWGEGTKFRLNLENQLKAVTIKHNFEGNPPKETLGVAIQDALGAWRGFMQFVMDETTKTINVTLGENTKSRVSTRAVDCSNIYVYSHFFVFPRSGSVKVNNTQTIKGEDSSGFGGREFRISKL